MANVFKLWFCSAIAKGTIVIRSQYLADGCSRLGSLLSVQAKRPTDVIVVAVKSSSGGGRCLCFFFSWVTSCFGGSQFRGLEGRVADIGADLLREPLVVPMSHSLPRWLLLLFLRLCLVSLVLDVKVLDLLTWLCCWLEDVAVIALMGDEFGVASRISTWCRSFDSFS